MPAMRGGMFWMKALYTACWAAAGYLAIERLSRPAGSGRRGWILGGVGAWAVRHGRRGPGDDEPRHPDGPAHAARSFLARLQPQHPVLGLPMLALGLWAVRGMAPTRPTLAGFAIGLFSGGVAATIYGLHCPEHTFTFVALWYSLGVLALAGPGRADRALGAALVAQWALSPELGDQVLFRRLLVD
jgi:hypothetical protein